MQNIDKMPLNSHTREKNIDQVRPHTVKNTCFRHVMLNFKQKGKVVETGFRYWNSVPFEYIMLFMNALTNLCNSSDSEWSFLSLLSKKVLNFKYYK